MITLVNINRTEDYIEANYYPEKDPNLGYVKMSLKDWSIIEHNNHPRYKSLPSKVVKVLKDIVRYNSDKKTVSIIWF